MDWVRDGVAAQNELCTGAYQAAVLDLGLPRQDGMQTLAETRARGIATPVLILTARDAIPARIAGLDSGADDYLVKPVDLHELAARLRALVRRAHGQVQGRLQAGAVTLEPAARQAWLDGAPVELSAREFDVLHALVLAAGRVLSREQLEQLEQQFYPWGAEVQSNTIEVHIYHLRRKLRPEVIETVRGVGYLVPKMAPKTAPSP